jgi:ElaB/YqjD/DUF883 family membrane-anchored ribosome-binding protein
MNRAVKEFERATRALAEVSQPILDRTRATAVHANRVAHKNTWAVAALALAAGALIGFLAAKR